MAQPFTTLERTFRLLTTGPEPLSVDGHAIGHGLPARRIPLDEARTILRRSSTSPAARNAVLAELLRGAQAGHSAATVGLAALLLPGLEAKAGPLLRARPEQREDIEAELLAGLLEAIRECDPHRRNIGSHLCWRAIRATYRALVREPVDYVDVDDADLPAPTAGRPHGYPEGVLAVAVAEGVLAANDAELIRRTRLEAQTIRALAAEWGINYRTLCSRRRRAEPRLVAWLLRRLQHLAGALGIAAVVVLAGAAPAQAQAPDLNTVVSNMVAWVTGMAAGLATLALSVGGLLLMLGGSNPAMLEKGKVALKAAAIGYGVAILAPTLLGVLNGFLGVGG